MSRLNEYNKWDHLSDSDADLPPPKKCPPIAPPPREPPPKTGNEPLGRWSAKPPPTGISALDEACQFADEEAARFSAEMADARAGSRRSLDRW